MAQLIPIRGIRYTPAAGSLDRLLAPPYDVVAEAERLALAAEPHNAIHLELAGTAPADYRRVATTLSAWLRDGILRQDETAMLYVYEQEFEEAGAVHARRGLMAGVEAQPWDERAVLPHEYTMSGPKEDRLRLLEATGVQFSPLLMVARDRAGQLRDFLADAVRGRAPDQEGTTAEERHRLWAVEGGRYEMRQLAPLLSETFYIADGHHRYETAVNYKLRRLQAEHALAKDHPARFALATVVAADDPGLLIRSIHRVVPRPAPSDWPARLATTFEVERLPAGADPAATVRRALESDPRALCGFGLEQGWVHRLVLRDPAGFAASIPGGHSELWAGIAANVVRFGLLEPLWGIDDEDLRQGAVEFTHDAAEAAAAVTGNPGGAVAFFVHPVGIRDVLALSDLGDRLPQKSTFFYPKLGTGLVFHALNP